MKVEVDINGLERKIAICNKISRCRGIRRRCAILHGAMQCVHGYFVRLLGRDWPD